MGAAAAAKSAQGMKPVLLKIYQAQMNAYQLAIQNFILGYKEGVNQPVNLDAWLDASHADSLPQASPKESSQASPIQSQQMTQNSSVHSESPEASSGSTMQELPLNSTSYSREQAGQIVQSPGTVTEVDYMGMNEIEDWNSHILSQESQGSPVQSADRVHSKSRSIQSSGNGDTQSDTQIRIPDDMLEQFDGSAQSTLSGPVSSVEGVLERDVSNALAEAERLSAIMLSGKFTAEQRSQFQTAVSRAEALISDAKRWIVSLNSLHFPNGLLSKRACSNWSALHNLDWKICWR